MPSIRPQQQPFSTAEQLFWNKKTPEIMWVEE